MAVIPSDALRDALAGFGPGAGDVLAQPAVVAALEAGGGLPLHDALRQARKAAASPEERETVDRMLASRRLFLTRASAPTMFRLNGVGTSLVGETEHAKDGTYVGTLFFTVLFLPIVPLSSWLVRRAGGRSWNFFGKVPLTALHRTWRFVAGLALLAIAVEIGWAATHRPGPKVSMPTLHVVNGLGAPVSVSIGERALRLGPDRVESLELPPGRYHARALLADARVVEELDLDISAGESFYAWNLLGAAPLRIVTFWYAAPGVSSPEPTTEELVGTSFVTRASVSYAFEDPPETLSLVGGRSTSRRRAIVAEGGWRSGVAVIANRGDLAGAAKLAERVSFALGDESTVELAAAAASAVGAEQMRRFAEAYVVRFPETVEGHRMVQEALLQLGLEAESKARYRAAFEKDPSSARAGYLYTRTLKPAEAAPLLERLAAEHPDDPWTQRALGWREFHRLQLEPALGHFQHAASVAPRFAAPLLPLRVRALAGLGRVGEAQTLAREAVEPGAWSVIELYGRLARLPGADASMPDVMDLVHLAAEPGTDLEQTKASVAVLARDASAWERRRNLIATADARAGGDLQLLAAADPARALSAAKELSDAAVQGVDDLTHLILACEAMRAGDRKAAERVYVPTPPRPGSLPALDALADPAKAFEDEDLDLDLQAALAVAAARRATDPLERERWMEAARRRDLLRCVVPRDAK